MSYGCATHRSKASQRFVVPGGTVVPSLGIGFDVYYDSALDDLIPGYKLLTVAYTNNTMDIQQMDSVNDEWYIEDKKGKSVKASINLRNDDPEIWTAMPQKMKIIIEYPLLIHIGKTVMIDLLVPEKFHLDAFKAVTFRSAKRNHEYRILPREE